MQHLEKADASGIPFPESGGGFKGNGCPLTTLDKPTPAVPLEQPVGLLLVLNCGIED